MRTLLFGFGACGAALLVAACDGGPNFAAAVDYVNECSREVRVSVSNTDIEELSSPTPSQAQDVPPGGHAVVINEILFPVPDTVYLYVAEESEPTFTHPSAIDVATLESRVADDGTTIYTIVVSGAMCP